MKCSLKQWQQIIKQPEDLIVAASNPDGNDTWTEHPIGMSSQITYFKERPEKFQLGNHLKTVTCSFLPHTDRHRRPVPPNRNSFLKILAENGIDNTHLSSREYFYSLPQYKFAISPEGNGIDCHRHYEALIAGTIPIVEDSPRIRQKYHNMPILYTKDYTEITEQYLEKKYEEMIDLEYDFTALFKSSWPKTVQQCIINSSNYWIAKNIKRTYYQSLAMPPIPI